MSLENFKLAIISSHRETDFATWRKSLAEVTICNLIPKWALFSDIGISLIKLAFFARLLLRLLFLGQFFFQFQRFSFHRCSHVQFTFVTNRSLLPHRPKPRQPEVLYSFCTLIAFNELSSHLVGEKKAR